MNNFVLTKGTQSYRDALAATDLIEAPVLGFVKPSDFTNSPQASTTIFKQNNTQIQLLTIISETLKEIQEDLKAILDAQRRGVQPSLPDSLIEKLQGLSLRAPKL